MQNKIVNCAPHMIQYDISYEASYISYVPVQNSRAAAAMILYVPYDIVLRSTQYWDTHCTEKCLFHRP